MIRTTRKRRNLTQKELALRCNLSQSYISKLENFKPGNSLPNLKLVILLAEELNISPYRLSNWFIKKEMSTEYAIEFLTIA